MKTNKLLQSHGRFNDTHYAAYYSELGVTILKQYPRKRKKEEWSEEQNDQRCRFGIINAFAKRNLFSLIRPIWNMQKGDGLNGYNRFIKKNSHAFDYDGNISDVSKLVLSSGILPTVTVSATSAEQSTNSIKITWDIYKRKQSERDFDQLAYIIYKEKEAQIPIFTTYNRKDGQCIIPLNDNYLSKNEVIFIFFSNYRKDKFSNSISIKI